MKLPIKLFFVLVILLNANILFAQVYPSISNYLRYGTGERAIGTYKGKFEYFENLTDVKLGLPNNITAGVRFLYDSPPEVGIPFKGIKRRFIEYRGNDLFVRVGNFSGLYGRGTAFNLFESRGLGYDTWMDGISAKYTSKYINVSIVGGTLDFQDSVEFVRKEYYNIRGGNVEVSPFDFIKAGFSFINAKGDFKLIPVNKQIEATVPSFYLTANINDLSFLLDYSYKRTRLISDNSISNGFGLYSSLSYFLGSLGITLDYKNYKFDERDPFERNDVTRPTRMLPFQNPPIVMKEHSYTLLTRAIHEIDFNDEVGAQLEIFYSPDENTNIDINASLASRHDLYVLNNTTFAFSKEIRSSNFLPSFDNKYSPYFEIFGEVEHFFSEQTSFKAAFARRTKTIYNEVFNGSNSHEIHSTVIPLQVKQTVNEFYSFEVEYQYESVFDSYNTQTDYYNQLFSITNSFESKLTVALRYEFSDNRYDVSGKRNWVTIELGYRINQSHSATISYGTERGGQICSNGVCRYLQPFEGFRFSLLSNI